MGLKTSTVVTAAQGERRGVNLGAVWKTSIAKSSASFGRGPKDTWSPNGFHCLSWFVRGSSKYEHFEVVWKSLISKEKIVHNFPCFIRKSKIIYGLKVRGVEFTIISLWTWTCRAGKTLWTPINSPTWTGVKGDAFVKLWEDVNMASQPNRTGIIYFLLEKI